MDQTLSIPELNRHICQYIRPRDYGSCALVSRAWYEFFAPWKWQSISLNKVPVEGVATLHKYRTFIRTLNLSSAGISSGTYHLFNHLQDLHFESNDYDPTSQQNVADLIRRNQSSLQSICFNGFFDDQSIIFEALLKLLSLKRLHYNNLKLQELVFMDSFMSICARLVTLRLDNVTFTEETHLMLKDQLFNSLEQLKIRHVYGPCLDFLRACPNLRVLSVYQLEDINTDELVELITTHYKQLSILRYCHYGFERVGMFEKLALLLPPMKCLQVEFVDRFDSQLPTSYFRHYKTLEAINIEHVLMNDGADTQTILSSCPSLRWFCGDFIFAEDIESGSPWVCQGLEYLQLEILVRNDNHRLDSVACAQLSQLKNLRSLNLSIPDHSNREDYYHRSLSLRLGEGLELLVSLSKLEHIGVGYLRPEWREDWRTEDIEWMAQAWPNLEAIYYDDCSDEIHSRLCTHFGVSRVTQDFPSSDYMDIIDF